MTRRGLTKLLHEGPKDFSQRAAERYPEEKNTINFFIELYINARYRSRQNKEQINKMKKLIKKL